MNWLYFLIGVSWVVFWVYWIAAAVRTGITTRRDNLRQRVWFVIIAVIIVKLLGRSVKLGNVIFQHQLLPKILGVIIFYAGISLAIWARRTMGSAWGMPMTTNKNPVLITGGPYRLVRHPIYAGVILMALGSALILTWAWALVLVLSTPYWIYCTLQEEKTLAKQFPKEFPTYKAQTKTLIPYLV